MGNTEKKAHDTNEHDYFGKSNILDVNGQKFHTVPVGIKEAQQGEHFINSFNTTNEFSKKHLLLSTNFKQQKAGLCGNSAILNCTFPFFPHSLENQIKRRSNNNQFNQYLKKEELLNIIYQIIDGTRNFDRIDQKVGDIRPSLIFLDEAKKNVKVFNYFTTPNVITGLQKAFESKQKALLAPQQLKALQKNNNHPDINVHKADSFSLGLTILAIGNLKKIHQDLYDYSNFSFSWTQLSMQLQNFERRYGSFLAQIVKGFVQNEPSNRLYIGQIGAVLQFYEKHIYEFLDFEPDFFLMRKSYETNYSGVKSDGFFGWLNNCKESYTRGQKPVESHSQLKNSNFIPPSSHYVAQTTSKVNNVRFTYTSPSQIKNREDLD